MEQPVDSEGRPNSGAANRRPISSAAAISPSTPTPSNQSQLPPRWQRILSTAVDGSIFLATPILWWHWSEWARFTTTFGRRWPAVLAMPVMMIIPFTPFWLEAVTGRSLGQAVARLRLCDRTGRRARGGRRLVRALLKWAPTLLGPVVWICDAARRRTYADDFTNDYLMPVVYFLTDHTPDETLKLVWALGLFFRGINWGAWWLAVLIAGYAAVLLPSRRTLLDRITGTQVLKRDFAPAERTTNDDPLASNSPAISRVERP